MLTVNGNIDNDTTATITVCCTDTDITSSFTVYVHHLDEGWYRFQNRESSKYMDVNSAGEGAQMVQNSSSAQTSQFFYLQRNRATGYFTIRNYSNNNYIGVENNATAHDADIKQYASPTGDGRQFTITKLRSSGEYKITPKTGEGASPQRVLAVAHYLLNSDGVHIKQRDWGENDDYYRDEWYVRPIEGTLNTPLEGQQQTEWCWVTSTRMSVRTHMNVTRTQTEAVIEVLGSAVNLGGNIIQAAQAAEFYSNNTLDYVYHNRAIYSEATIQQFIDDGVPVFVARVWLDEPDDPSSINGGHSTVIFGYTWNEQAQRFDYLIRDPWPVDQGETVVMSYAKLCNGEHPAAGEDKDPGVWLSVVTQDTAYDHATIPWPLA